MPTLTEIVRHRATQYVSFIALLVGLITGIFTLDNRYAKAETSEEKHEAIVVELNNKITNTEQQLVQTLTQFQAQQQTQMDLNKLESYNNLIMQYELQQERDQENEKIRKNLEKLERRRDGLEMKIQQRMEE